MKLAPAILMLALTSSAQPIWRNQFTTNQPPSPVYGTVTLDTNLHLSGPALSFSSTASNNPAQNELPTAQWVRGLLSGGVQLYNVTNVHPVNPTNFIASSMTNSTAQVRLYTNMVAGNYAGSIMSTQRFSAMLSPVTVNIYLSLSGGGSAMSIHPEIYYSYDGTNLLGDWDCGAQNVVLGSTNLYTFVISFPQVNATNATGFYVVRKVKVNSASGPNHVLGIHGSGPTPSHISFNTASAASTPATPLYVATNIIEEVASPPTPGAITLDFSTSQWKWFTNSIVTNTTVTLTNLAVGADYTIRMLGDVATDWNLSWTWPANAVVTWLTATQSYILSNHVTIVSIQSWNTTNFLAAGKDQP